MLQLHRELWGQFRGLIEVLIKKTARERGLDINAQIAAITFTQLIDGREWLGGAGQFNVIDEYMSDEDRDALKPKKK